MNKILLTSVFVFIFLAGFLSGIAQPTIPGKIIHTNDSSACVNCPVDDLHGVALAEFINVTARYRSTHQALFNAYAKGQLDNSSFPNRGDHMDDSFEDARSCWFALDTIKKFICLLERYSKIIGLSSSNLGIRFYYGVYWSGYERNPAFSNCHTLYLTATQNYSTKGINEDFDPRLTVEKKSLQSLSGLIRSHSTPANMFILGGGSLTAARNRDGGVSTMNQGDLCPPAKGCNRTLAEIDDRHPVVLLNNTRQ